MDREQMTEEQRRIAYELAAIIAENDRREAEAVQGYTDQLSAISRAQEAFEGVDEVLAFLEELEAATKEKTADELSHARDLLAEYTALTGITAKED